ncbi:hypothetical protein MKK70_16520 [Methylobacterium sp. E-041]|uniref:hypothetical protein n=1 Tax=Methylobacterium sp. E-041 TaxID=2836573 RepID=UPI001FBA4E13|nr:hypothetical protein [Methylobacterium sp. E-041]MCJ2106950.1 hypothetical protein [Methylobacterium sp. E-041]
MLAALIIFAVGAANGRPSVFPDTAWYYSQGEYFASRLGIETQRASEDREADPTSMMPRSEAMRKRIPATVAGGRSPYYGIALVATVEIGTLWLLAAIQAFVATWLITMLMRTSFPPLKPRHF